MKTIEDIISEFLLNKEIMSLPEARSILNTELEAIIKQRLLIQKTKIYNIVMQQQQIDFMTMGISTTNNIMRQVILLKEEDGETPNQGQIG